MKKTFDLYRCSPLCWANMGYEEALHFRIEMAEKAKDFYRTQSRKFCDKWSNENHQQLEELTKLYTASDDAVKWNKRFLNEIKQEREEKKNELNDYECEGRVLPDQRTTYQSNYGKTGNTSLLVRFWKWLNSLFP